MFEKSSLPSILPVAETDVVTQNPIFFSTFTQKPRVDQGHVTNLADKL